MTLENAAGENGGGENGGGENGGGQSAGTPEGSRPPSNVGEALRALKASQKTSKGAPAYSRFVNRRLGRLFAAIGYVAGRTPNTPQRSSASTSASAP